MHIQTYVQRPVYSLAHTDVCAEMPWCVCRHMAHNLSTFHRCHMYANFNSHFMAIFHNCYYFTVLWISFCVNYLVPQDKRFLLLFFFNVSIDVCKTYIKVNIRYCKFLQTMKTLKIIKSFFHWGKQLETMWMSWNKVLIKIFMVPLWGIVLSNY